MADCSHSRQLCNKDLLNSKTMLFCKICKKKYRWIAYLCCFSFVPCRFLMYLIPFFLILIFRFFSVGWMYVLGMGALPSYKVCTCNYPSPLVCLTICKFIQKKIKLFICSHIYFFFTKYRSGKKKTVIPFHDWIDMTVWNYHSLI